MEQPQPPQPPQPQHQHACAHCGQVFRHAWRLTAHVHDRHPAEPWRCGNCGKVFASSSSLARHTRTEHTSAHTFKCRTCGKGFVEKKRLQHHVHGHTLAGLETVAPPRGSLSQALRESAARESTALRQLAKLTRTQCTPGHCKVVTRDRATTAFLCWQCKRYRHWDCAGYSKHLLDKLPLMLCAVCLQEEHRAADTCFLAAVNRQLLEAHVATTGTLCTVPADGWCLIKCVAQATSQDHNDLFTNALVYLVSMLDTLQIDTDERDALRQTCQKLLGGNTRVQMGQLWDSALTDQLPAALAGVTQRPLHIVEATGDVIRVTVIPCTPADAASEPIVLARSFTELGMDHYDLVV
eukprot:m.30056 g.30056  ORF g.30056 m.30056 type:complete len:352 (-) comp10522_c0_seq1:293-1348(-)